MTTAPDPRIGCSIVGVGLMFLAALETWSSLLYQRCQRTLPKRRVCALVIGMSQEVSSDWGTTGYME